MLMEFLYIDDNHINSEFPLLKSSIFRQFLYMAWPTTVGCFSYTDFFLRMSLAQTSSHTGMPRLEKCACGIRAHRIKTN
jgi:hypothetical protein